MFDKTLNVPLLPAAAARLSDVGEPDNIRLKPLCVTVTVCDATPVPDTVTVAERDVSPVFSCAVTVTIALFEPEVGLSVSHV